MARIACVRRSLRKTPAADVEEASTMRVYRVHTHKHTGFGSHLPRVCLSVRDKDTHLLAAVRVMPIPAAVSPRRAIRTLGLLWKVSTRSCLSFGCIMIKIQEEVRRIARKRNT